MTRILIAEDDLSVAGSNYVHGCLFYVKEDIKSKDKAKKVAEEWARKFEEGELDPIDDYHDFEEEYWTNHMYQEVDLKNKRVRYFDPDTYDTKKANDVHFDFYFGYQDLDLDEDDDDEDEDE